MLGRFVAQTDGWEAASGFIGGGNGAVGTNTFFIAYDLDPSQTWAIRLINVLEPVRGYRRPVTSAPRYTRRPPALPRRRRSAAAARARRSRSSAS